MEYLRTPDYRFENLVDYPFCANYADVSALGTDSLRMHYIDEGEGHLILCLHGQPSWSYLYRKMIPLLVSAGCRVVAPDLIGFGKSDKPIDRGDYTYANHVAWVRDLLTSLDLTNITLVGQDWGGLIGLRVAAENSERFSRIVAANTGLPDARQVADDEIIQVSEAMRSYYNSLRIPQSTIEMAQEMVKDRSGMGFFHWVKYCSESDSFSPSEILTLTTGGTMKEAEQEAYAAPFPEASFLAGARQFPSLVPIIPDNVEVKNNRAAWDVFKNWNKPFLTAFSDSDPITAGWDARFQAEIPGAKGQRHRTIEGAGHFLQEQSPKELSQMIIDFLKDNPC